MNDTYIKTCSTNCDWPDCTLPGCIEKQPLAIPTGTALPDEQVHELKIWPEYFDDVESGRKTFEVRKSDRPFKVGDILHLREWAAHGYSGRETKKRITYIMKGGQWGLAEGNCILGIQSLLSSEGEDELDLWYEVIEMVLNDDEKYNRGLDNKLSKLFTIKKK